MAGARAGARVPLLGEHGRRVMAEVLRRSAQEIEKLIEEKVLCD
jgi:crotonobetainyl-CoA:carnitine CoA-transferase CaiB-like acyl-CoA transferase